MKFSKKKLIIPTQYNKFHILIHWLVVLTILLQMISGDKIALEFLAHRNDPTANEGSTNNSQIHILGGLFIFLLMAIRVFFENKIWSSCSYKRNK